MQWLKNLFTPRSSAAGPRGKVPGRNEPCWCGSGKKYKQCHLRKDSADRIEAGHAARAAQIAARNAGLDGVTRSGGKTGTPKAGRPPEAADWKGGGKAP
jgi:hypothetical protein